MIDKKPTMTNRINKTSICSVLFLDIIDYSEKSDAHQIEIKKRFNDLVSHSLRGVAKDDRILLDTGDGVVIAFMGAPEDLMFVALTIRDDILEGNIHSQVPLFVRFGINLGPVRTVSDINGRPNIVGDGINVAQRIMSFSEPNQILVSRSYYEITSRLTEELSEMFAYSGVKQDKHVRDHEVYSVRYHSNQEAKIGKPDRPKDKRRSTDRYTVNWSYAIPGLLIIPMIFALVKSPSTPSEPIISSTEQAISATEKSSASSPSLAKSIKEKLALKTLINSVKNGQESECNQAQAVLGQCK
jgi:class 3 adenylate cyclase